MDQSDRDNLKQNILCELEKVRQDIKSLSELVRPVAPDDAIGRLTRMEAINSKSINEAKLGDAKSRLVLLEMALAMVDEPGFGTCIECGDDIPLARLQLMPETTICVECASS